MSDWTEKYHLRPAAFYPVCANSRWYIVVAYSNYAIDHRIVDLGHISPSLYLFDSLNELMRTPPVYENNLKSFRFMTDAEIANEILMGSPLAAARERMLQKYGEYRYEGSLLKEGQ